jgi:DNA topoisomerase I
VAIGSGDVNDYLRQVTGEDFTAKDFRTWAGTLQAVAALEAAGPAPSGRETKSAILRAIDEVANRLNNTRAVCRKYHIHPAVLEQYEAGTLHESLGNGRPPNSATPKLEPGEQALVRLLRAAA